MLIMYNNVDNNGTSYTDAQATPSTWEYAAGAVILFSGLSCASAKHSLALCQLGVKARSDRSVLILSIRDWIVLYKRDQNI